MTSDEGFILSNKYRRAIFDELASGESNIMTIAKKQRIIPRIAQRVISDFESLGIVEKKNNRYVFTKKGEKLVETLA